MRIAVDARGLASPMSGIGRYTQCMLEQLVEFPEHEWFLYSDRPLLYSLDNSNVHVRQSNNSNRLFSLFRTQYLFSSWAKKDQIEIFWSPRHHLPLLLPKQIKTVVTIHDLVWLRFPETMARANYLLEKFLMPLSITKADIITAVSESTRLDVIDSFTIEPEKIHKVLAAASEIDSERECIRLELANYFLFVGTLEPRKNLDGLLRSFDLYCERGGGNKLIIIGAQGWMKPIGADSDRNIEFLGHIGDDDLLTYYKFADALLLPSFYEGFGLPAVEAMRFGVPVIGSNRGSIPEVVGDAGILVDPLSSTALAQAMYQLEKIEGLRNRLGEVARSRALDFSWENSAKKFEAILRSLL